jgi:hypothetical protein
VALMTGTVTGVACGAAACLQPACPTRPMPPNRRHPPPTAGAPLPRLSTTPAWLPARLRCSGGVPAGAAPLGPPHHCHLQQQGRADAWGQSKMREDDEGGEE